jgi:hypothetical protein
LTENCIRFVSAEQSDYGDERYELVIQPGGVNLMAAQGGAGFFYGIQTLLQSIPVAELGLRKKTFACDVYQNARSTEVLLPWDALGCESTFLQ